MTDRTYHDLDTHLVPGGVEIICTRCYFASVYHLAQTATPEESRQVGSLARTEFLADLPICHGPDNQAQADEWARRHATQQQYRLTAREPARPPRTPC